MPVLVVFCALLQDLPNVFISSLNCSISLRTIRRRLVVLNVELLYQLFCFSFKMLPIVRDNFIRYPVSADDIGLNELSNDGIFKHEPHTESASIVIQ